MFEEVEVIVGTKKVVWEALGEGLSGDYDPSDPEDRELLRFSCSRLNEDGEWEELPDSSYCTLLPVSQPFRDLVNAGGIIIEAIQSAPYKKRLEELSWFNPDDFNRPS